MVVVSGLLFGVVLYKAEFFSRSGFGTLGKLERTSTGRVVVSIFAIVLWLGVFPLTLLWVYHWLHNH